MVLEIAEISARAGTETDLTEALRAAAPLLADAAGLRTLRLISGVESPTRFVLLVEWDSVEAHQQFTTTPEFGKFRELVAPFFDGPPRAEHFNDIAV